MPEDQVTALRIFGFIVGYFLLAFLSCAWTDILAWRLSVYRAWQEIRQNDDNRRPGSLNEVSRTPYFPDRGTCQGGSPSSESTG